MINKKYTKSRLLVGVSTALTAFGATGLSAAETIVVRDIDFSQILVSTTNGYQSIQSTPSNDANVSALISGANGGITRTGLSTGSSDSVTANIIAAGATGNSFTNSLSSLLLDSDATTDGLATLGVAINRGIIQSSVTGSSLSLSLTDVTSGSAVNSVNAISARTTINSGTSSIAGQVPSTYASSLGGSASIDLSASAIGGDSLLQNAATVAVASVQVAGQSGSAGLGSSMAVVDNNDVTLALASTGNQAVTTAAALDNNSVSATFAANQATSSIALAGGQNPAFTGSAVVSNAQTYAVGPVSPLSEQARNTDSTIAASVAGDQGGAFVNTLRNGSVSVDGNAITSTASGNVSLANGISLADGLNVSSVSTVATANMIASPTSFQLDTLGGLAVGSAQQVTGSEGAIVALTQGASVTADVQDIDRSSISIADNMISATSRGNNVSNVIETLSPISSLNSSVNAAAMQTVNDVAISSTVENSLVRAVAGSDAAGVAGSQVSLVDNSVSAGAYGNQASQRVALDATTLTLGAGPATASIGGSTTSLSGAAIVANQQTLFSADVSATNANSRLEIQAIDNSDTGGSTLLSSGNRQEALALGALATNGLSLAGTTIGAGAAIVSSQVNDAGSTVSATLSATNRISTSEDIGQDAATSVDLVNNIQRAIAYGASSQNDLNVSATSASMDASNLTSVSSGTANAGYALLNSQRMDGDVLATAASGGVGEGAFEVRIGLDVEGGSSVRNDGNTLLAAGYGTSASNASVLDIGNLTVNSPDIDTFAPVANVVNEQRLFGGVTAQVQAGGTALFNTIVEDDVQEGASVSTSGNLVQAQALGNNAIANSLSVTSTTLSAFGNGLTPGVGTVTPSAGVVDAAFAVANFQQADLRTVLASVNSGSDAARVRTFVDDDIRDASVVSNDNRSLARATANQATNQLDLAATTLRTTGALVSTQNADSYVIARNGIEGVAGVPATPGQAYSSGGNGTYAQSSYNSLTETLTIGSGGSVSIDISSTPVGAARDGLIALLQNAGFTVSGTTALASAPGNYDLSFFDSFSQSGAATGTIAFSGFATPGSPGSAAVPTLGGVTIAVGGDIGSSTVRVADNTQSGSAIVNSAGNVVNVAATNLAADGTHSGANIGAGQVSADYTLVNSQSASGLSAASSEVFGTFAIDQAANRGIDASTIDVSGNAQSSTAVANAGANTLTVTATDMASAPSSAVIASEQDAFGVVIVTSGMMVSAPVSSNGSSITLNDNSNSALGVANDVSNRLAVSATNLGSGNGLNAVGGVSADNMLSNNQFSIVSLTSTASSDISNQDALASTDGLQSGSLAMNGNVTSAEASANRAINVATVEASASQGATTSLSNDQTSLSNATANAATVVRVNLAGTFIAGDPAIDLAAARDASVSINGNTSTSLARGNSATNTLTSLAGANYVPLNSGTAPGSVGQMADAASVVLNRQNNGGNVSASSTGATYVAVLNNVGGAAVTNGMVNVGNNRVDATAFGNTATNTLAMTPLNTGLSTGAVNNYQTNNGVITASVTSASFSINTNGGTTGTSFTAGSNAIRATAIGNNAVSTIGTVGR